MKHLAFQHLHSHPHLPPQPMLLRHKNLPAALLADEIFLPWLGKQKQGRVSLPFFQCYHGGAKRSCELSRGQNMAEIAFASISAGSGHTERARRTCCSCWVSHRVWAHIGPSPGLSSFLRASLPGLILTSQQWGSLWGCCTGVSHGHKWETRTRSAGHISGPLKSKDGGTSSLAGLASSHFLYSCLSLSLVLADIKWELPHHSPFSSSLPLQEANQTNSNPQTTFISSALPTPHVFLQDSSKIALQVFSKTGETSDSTKNV